jgi:hypothetical protein
MEDSTASSPNKPKMSMNWDNIDSRQLKAKQEAKDLKIFLQAQQEETKKR